MRRLDEVPGCHVLQLRGINGPNVICSRGHSVCPHSALRVTARQVREIGDSDQVRLAGTEVCGGLRSV